MSEIEKELEKILKYSYYYNSSGKIKNCVNKIKNILNEDHAKSDEDIYKVINSFESFLNNIENNNEKLNLIIDQKS